MDSHVIVQCDNLGFSDSVLSQDVVYSEPLFLEHELKWPLQLLHQCIFPCTKSLTIMLRRCPTLLQLPV